MLKFISLRCYCNCENVYYVELFATNKSVTKIVYIVSPSFDYRQKIVYKQKQLVL